MTDSAKAWRVWRKQAMDIAVEELVFDPPWDPSRMSDEAKLQLNMF